MSKQRDELMEIIKTVGSDYSQSGYLDSVNCGDYDGDLSDAILAHQEKQLEEVRRAYLDDNLDHVGDAISNLAKSMGWDEGGN